MTSKVFHIGLENNAEGRSQAWVLDHPGCFAYGVDGASALAAAPDAIRKYAPGSPLTAQAGSRTFETTRDLAR